MCQHITVILRNSSGAFAGVTKLLKAEDVNILAFHVGGSSPGHGYAQLVCDDHLKALAVLTGVFQNYAYESEIIAIKTLNKPGSLHDVMSQLAAAKVNVENAYQTLDYQGSAIIVIEPSQSQVGLARSTLAGKHNLIDDFRSVKSPQ